MKTDGSSGVISLPRRGIFLAKEARGAEICFRRPEQADKRPAAEVEASFRFDCFLCEAPLSQVAGASNQDTHEHVFPQWLQEYFDIRHHRTVHAEANSRTYDEFKIPACATCNNTYLSQFETRIKNALLGGFDRFVMLRKSDIFLWCGKIYYGAVHADVLPRDPRTREPLKPVLSKEALEDIAFLKLLLQGFRKRVMIMEPDSFPFSVIFLRLHSGRDKGFYFKVKTAVNFPGIALQLGLVGIIVVCDDYGETELEFERTYKKPLSGKILHPIQFWELAGRLFYKSSRCPLATRSFSADGPENLPLWLAPRPERPFEPRGEDEAYWISKLTGEPMECFWNTRTGKGMTSLMKPDGNFNELEFVDISV
jgi:hypothetical protein